MGEWWQGPHDDIQPWCEVRPNEDGSIDEIVTHQPVTVHLEQMDTGRYWIGLTDAEGNTQHIMLHRERKHIYPTVYR